MLVKFIMKIFEKFFKNNEKLNANEVAICTDEVNNKYQTLDAYLNSKKLKKLWENQSPDSNFAAQDMTLSSDDYDYLIVLFKLDKNQATLMATMTLKNYGFTLNGGGNAHVSGSSNYVGSTYVRHCQRISDIKFSIPSTTVYVGNSTTTGADGNVYLIPVVVFGGKF